MSALFSSPKIPTPPRPAPPPPAQDAAAVQDASRAERQRLATAAGRGSTILTATSDVQGRGRGKTLLGAG